MKSKSFVGEKLIRYFKADQKLHRIHASLHFSLSLLFHSVSRMADAVVGINFTWINLFANDGKRPGEISHHFDGRFINLKHGNEVIILVWISKMLFIHSVLFADI